MIDTAILRAFEDALVTRGIAIPQGGVVADGKLHRCDTTGRNGKGDAAYVLYPDAPVAGGFENWQDGLGWQTWKGNGLGRRPTEAERAAWAETQQAREAERAKAQAAAEAEARRLWESGAPADASHPYLSKKKIPGDGLRADGAGNLLVPLQDTTGTIRNVQRIFPDGAKRFQTGAPVAGLFFVVGSEPEPDDVVVVVEGAADAIAVFRSTGRRVYAAMSSGNLPEIGRSVRREHPEARLVYFADHDNVHPQTGKRPGIEKATEAASATGGRVVVSPVEGEDPCDVYTRGGEDAVREILAEEARQDLRIPDDVLVDEAHRLTPSGKQGRPLLESVSVLLENPPRPTWFVEGRIETPSSAMVFGASGTGKSFVALDLAMEAATGGQWAGIKVNAPGFVVYMAGEGRAGLLRRTKAWEIHHKTKIPDGRLYVSGTRLPLDEAGAEKLENAIAERVQETGNNPSLIVVDTLARHMRDGGNENHTPDMNEFINRLDRLRDRFGCVVLVVHHTGHAEQDRARGASSNKAAMDTEIRVNKRGGSRVMEWTKMRDCPDDPAPQEFTLKPVLLEATEDGELVRSAVVSWKGAAPSSARVEMTKAEALGMNTLRLAIAKGGGLSASVDTWREEFYGKHWGDDPKTKKKAFARVRESLATKGLVRIHDGNYLIPTPGDRGTEGDNVSFCPRAEGGQGGHTPIGVSPCPPALSPGREEGDTQYNLPRRTT